ncbi:MAG: TetR/AcrR family transcriptional regulator [Deltaproteobacteria bacterium]|nr:TetR/AcrR family transcriptional regulator [Deltaproteobacteria bacterium]
MTRSALEPLRGALRERTRELLLDAAVRVFARKGAGAAAIHEIAAEAGVANGTFYNYFRTREELLEATSLRIAGRLHDAIGTSRSAADDPAERIAIGCRRFVGQVEQDRVWAAALLRVWHSTSIPSLKAADPLLADLRAGRRRGRFHYSDEHVALDLVQGTVLAGMRSVLEGRPPKTYASAIAVAVLRGLGVPPAEAEAISARPLPPLAAPASAPPTGRTRPSRRARR